MQKPYFPLFIDISKEKIIVIGGGRIAERRVETLLEFAECIQVVSPDISEELQKLADLKKVAWIKGNYSPEVLAGARLVLVATNNPACNEQVAEDCRRLGIPVNTSHKKELCDFYFPAVAVHGNVVAGITASGLDHAQARHVRERVEQALEGK